MKYTLFLLFTLSLNISVALAFPGITSFQAKPLSLQNNEIVVSSTTSTNVIFDITIARHITQSGYEDVFMPIHIVYYKDGNEEVLSTDTVVSNDFNDGGIAYRVIDASIPANKIGGRIKLKYTYRKDGETIGPNYCQWEYTTRLFAQPPVKPLSDYPIPIFKYLHDSDYEDYFYYDFTKYYSNSRGGASDVQFLAFEKPQPGTIPIYKFQQRVSRRGLDDIDYAYLLNSTSPGATWGNGSVVFYIYSEYAPGTIPLYAFYSSAIGKHTISANPDEITTLNNDPAWRKDGLLGYVLPSTPKPTDLPLYIQYVL